LIFSVYQNQTKYALFWCLFFIPILLKRGSVVLKDSSRYGDTISTSTRIFWTGFSHRCRIINLLCKKYKFIDIEYRN